MWKRGKNIMEKLYELLEDIRPDVDFRNVNSLVSDGYIDSFDIVTIISSIEEEYSVEIPVDNMLPENFDSVESIMNLINSSKGE